MRLHIIGCHAYPSREDLPIHCYGMVSYNLTTELYKAGHEVHYYGWDHSTVKCTKKHSCGSESKYNKEVNTDENNTVIDFQYSVSVGSSGIILKEKEFTTRACEQLEKEYKKNDIILCMWSGAIEHVYYYFNKIKMKPKIVDAHIGHHDLSPVNTLYHVYTSYTNQAFSYGKHHERKQELNWKDTVIYPMANKKEYFTYKNKKKDYFLFMARLIPHKGIEFFVNLAKYFPEHKFIISGHAVLNYILKKDKSVVNKFIYEQLDKLPSNVEYVGLLNQEKRKEYLSNAKAIISASNYCEPFGLTVVEAGFSGTPVITSDSGGYTETVINGYNGYRCSWFTDFVHAIKNIDKIKPKDCLKNAERFSVETLIKEWEIYLEHVAKEHWFSPYKRPYEIDTSKKEN